jgi:undecaprenyl-diphosphatase
MMDNTWLLAILKIDEVWLREINVGLNSETLTPLMELLSSSRFGVFLSLGVILSICYVPSRDFLWKKAVFFIVTISTVDFLCFTLLKKSIKRLRPCEAKPFEDLFYLDGCAGLYGFPSNHASNVACFIVLLFLLGHQRLAKFLLPLGVSVGFSRVYLGAHFPLDVVGGFLWGGLFAYLAVTICGSRLQPTNESHS